ncbi:MAG: proline dehydrogenase family protein [Longimicrobiales bacterium]
MAAPLPLSSLQVAFRVVHRSRRGTANRMLRQALLWASKNPTLAERLPRYGFVRRATRRFMPGEGREDAVGAAVELGAGGIAATLTLLGENHRAESEADEVVEHYREVLAAIEGAGVDAEISVKPTQMGLDFDAPRTRDRIATLARATKSTLWIDMESSKYVDATLDIYRSLRAESANVGVCLQAYLHRTEADLEALLPLDPSIRVVKGAYQEPPSVAMPKKSDVDRAFVRLTSRLLHARAQGGTGRPVVGTHDPRMIAEAGRFAIELGLAKDTCEYALLYGIARPEQQRLARNGHRVRVLISYGAAWFPWYMRRLAERPANLWFVAKQLVG